MLSDDAPTINLILAAKKVMSMTKDINSRGDTYRSVRERLCLRKSLSMKLR